MPYGLELAQAAGAQAAGGIVSETLGLATQGLKNKQQLKQARRLQDLGLEAEATRMQRNEAMAMRMFENTGYGAQMEQMKRAGLNPALLYGMSAGSGGATAQGPSGGSAGQAGVAQASRGSEGMGLMIGQMGLMQAQKENIEADTELKKTQAGETDTRAALGDLELKFRVDSYEDNLDIIRATFSNLQEDANRKNRENRIGDKTEGEQTFKIKEEALGAFLENELIRAQTGKTQQEVEQSKAEVKKWAAEIAQQWFNLDRQERELKLKRWEAEIRANFPSISQSIGKMINNAVSEVEKLATGGGADPVNKAPNTNK